jgi:hypothetical protein
VFAEQHRKPTIPVAQNGKHALDISSEVDR